MSFRARVGAGARGRLSYPARMRWAAVLLSMMACTARSPPDARAPSPDAAVLADARRFPGADAAAVNEAPPATLHEAALRCDHARIAELMREEAEVDARTREGRTPLHEAAGRCDVATVKLLVDAGADVRARDSDGMTPLHEACSPSRTGSGPYAIWRAGDPEVVAFLVDRGADPRAGSRTGWTPLHAATQVPDGGGEVVTLLLGRGAGLDAVDVLGWTPLHFAARFDAVDVARILVARGARQGARTAAPRTVLAAVYPAGSTPLDVARTSGSRRVLELLSGARAAP